MKRSRSTMNVLKPLALFSALLLSVASVGCVEEEQLPTEVVAEANGSLVEGRVDENSVNVGDEVDGESVGPGDRQWEEGDEAPQRPGVDVEDPEPYPWIPNRVASKSDC
jgi:hypothetical protein